MRDGLTADGILLIVKDEDNLSCLAEMLGVSDPGEEEVPEGSELDRPAVAGALHVFTGSEVEVDANGDQVGNMVGSGVGGGSCLDDNGLDDPEGDCLFLLDRRIFETVGLGLPCEALVKPNVRLGVSRFSGAGKTIQEVGRCNRPPCLRNRFFPQSFHLVLGVLGVGLPY